MLTTLAPLLDNSLGKGLSFNRDWFPTIWRGIGNRRLDLAQQACVEQRPLHALIQIDGGQAALVNDRLVLLRLIYQGLDLPLNCRALSGRQALNRIHYPFDGRHLSRLLRERLHLLVIISEVGWARSAR
jgi:hypothetical protein